MTIKDLQIGDSAIVKTVGGEGALRQHFLDMGVIPGVMVTLVKYAPMGDPLELRVFSYELTLRKDEASQIEVVPVSETVSEAGKQLEEKDLNQNIHKHIPLFTLLFPNVSCWYFRPDTFFLKLLRPRLQVLWYK